MTASDGFIDLRLNQQDGQNQESFWPSFTDIMTVIVMIFMLAMVIITIAEMLVSPVGQAVVAKLSPEDMRGRYMAIYGFSWTIPTAIGPLAAGLIMDNYNSNWVWYACGIILLLSASIFAYLQIKASDRFANINGDKISLEPEGLPG